MVNETYFKRKLENYLQLWRTRTDRKPLVIRGARQVGKSTLVQHFGKSYPYFISLNLERPEHQRIFKSGNSTKNIVDAIFLQSGTRRTKQQTLIFIDEIQAAPYAIQQLRYLYEDHPELHIIAAGSLLEFAFDRAVSFPVGRVEQVLLHPFDFEEFLLATGHTMAYEALRTIPISEYAHSQLLEFFHQFALVGGMPAAIQTYVAEGHASNIPFIYQQIWKSFTDDVEKYARNIKERNLIRHLMRLAPQQPDRVNFSTLTKGKYTTVAISEAFEAIDQSRVIRLIYPTTSVTVPASIDLRKRPRLQFLDTGMLIHALNLGGEIPLLDDLSSLTKGRIIQHLVAQEFLAQFHQPLYDFRFWVREKASSTAEVDLVHPYQNILIPIETKAGKQGRLRSLQLFVDAAGSRFAIRLLANTFSKESVKTRAGTPYVLYNLPYYLAGQLPRYFDWIVSEDNL